MDILCRLSRDTDWTEDFLKYRKAVLSSSRAHHTFSKRLKTISDLASGFEEKRVIDVGCGYGFRTLAVAQRGAELVVGLDLDRKRVHEASRYASEHGLKNLKYVVGQCENAPFQDKSFDLVTADELIHHLISVKAFLREVRRILKPGGMVVISDHNRFSLLSELSRTIYFRRNKEKVYTPRHIRKLLATEGFTDILYEYIIFTFPSSRFPDSLLKLNIQIERSIERTPFLKTQCGVYVIRGKKDY